MGTFVEGASERGRQLQKERAALKVAMVDGTVAWDDVIRNPPECVHGLLLIEVLVMIPGVGRRRVETLGRAAFADGIVLTGRCERTSELTRWWVCNHLHHKSSGRRARRHGSARRAAYLA